MVLFMNIVYIHIPTTRSKLNEIQENDEGEKDDAPAEIDKPSNSWDGDGVSGFPSCLILHIYFQPSLSTKHFCWTLILINHLTTNLVLLSTFILQTGKRRKLIWKSIRSINLFLHRYSSLHLAVPWILWYFIFQNQIDMIRTLWLRNY